MQQAEATRRLRLHRPVALVGMMGSGKSALRAYSTRSVKPNPIMQDRKG